VGRSKRHAIYQRARFDGATDLEQTALYIGHWALMGFGYWVIEEKATGEFVGDVGFADFKRFAGTRPVTVSRSQVNNGTGCLTLTVNASGNSASLSFRGQTLRSGSFTIITGIVLVTITQPEGSQNGAFLFVGPARRGHIGPGSFEQVSGGANFDAGVLAFGMKNGC
jgi:hypothetical protein